MIKQRYIGLAPLRHSDAQMYNITQYKWSNKDIQVLGVTVSYEDIVTKNYGTIIEKAKGILSSWENRGITLMARVQVVNTLVASLFCL